MTKDYSRNKASADRMIQKFGQALTFTLKADNSDGFDEFGDSEAPDAPTTVDGYGVKLDYESGEIDGKNVISGDAKLLISTDGVIVANMTTIINGETWRIVKPNPLEPADVLIMYESQIRR